MGRRGRRRDHKVNGAWKLGAIALIAIAASIALATSAQPAVRVQDASRPDAWGGFARPPMDRPVLESIGQVYEARRTGVSVFRFDGIEYTVMNLPEEYVDYSAMWVRLP